MSKFFVFLAVSFCFYCNTSFSQLDSVSVSVTFTTDANVTDTLMMPEVINAVIWMNDTDFIGQAMISVFDPVTNFPLARVKVDRQEMINAGYILNTNTVSFPIGNLPSNGQYSIEFELKDFQLNYLAPISISYP